MPIETFTPKRFTAEHTTIIDTARSMCQDYQRQGLSLTLRQVYYQFVSRDLIANTQQSYKRLGSILNDARMAGLLDWSYMEDRGRNVTGGFWGYQAPGHFIDGVADRYVENLWEGQDYRPEVWVEKEALVSIISRACGPSRTPYLACKGYMSQSEMYAAAKRFQRRRDDGTTPVVIHLGDHDPSGIDMTRDIQDRLELMSWGDVEVRRIALTREQIDTYAPPPNPAKITDSRATDYIAEHGPESWELDALSPEVLVDLIRDTLDDYIDQDTMDAARAHEEAGEDRIRLISDRWQDLEYRWDDVVALLDGDDA